MPICDLAPDLLTQIFDMVVYYERVDDYYRSPRAAVALSLTCSYWRNLCISYPELWTFLPVAHMSKRLRRLFVERCASRPLTLYFDWGDCTLYVYMSGPVTELVSSGFQ